MQYERKNFLRSSCLSSIFFISMLLMSISCVIKSSTCAGTYTGVTTSAFNKMSREGGRRQDTFYRFSDRSKSRPPNCRSSTFLFRPPISPKSSDPSFPISRRRRRGGRLKATSEPPVSSPTPILLGIISPPIVASLEKRRQRGIGHKMAQIERLFLTSWVRNCQLRSTW